MFRMVSKRHGGGGGGLLIIKTRTTLACKGDRIIMDKAF